MAARAKPCLPPPEDATRTPQVSGTFTVGKNPRISWADLADLGIVVAIPRPPRVPVFEEPDESDVE